MSRQKAPRHPSPARTKRFRSSTWRLAATQRFRLSWTRWSLTRTQRLQARAERRLILLRLETDHQLLVTKELELQRRGLEHRQQELAEARDFRLGILPTPAPLPPPSPRQELDRLLGL